MDGTTPRCAAGQSTQQAVLFKTDEALLVVQGFLVYPTGIEFTFNFWLRHSGQRPPTFPWDFHGQQRVGPLPDEFLRLGILLSDGMKWTNVDSLLPERGDQREPAGLHVSPGWWRRWRRSMAHELLDVAPPA